MADHIAFDGGGVRWPYWIRRKIEGSATQNVRYVSLIRLMCEARMI